MASGDGGAQSGFNAFKNDGSFLEQFKKMEEQRLCQTAAAGATDSTASRTKPPLSIKLKGIESSSRRSCTDHGLKGRSKSASIKQAFRGNSSDSESEEEGRKGTCASTTCTKGKLGKDMHVHAVHHLLFSQLSLCMDGEVVMTT